MIGLEYVRRIKCLSIKELANLINVSRQTVSYWENKKMPISEESLNNLSIILNVGKEILTEETNDDLKKEILYLEYNQLGTNIK